MILPSRCELRGASEDISHAAFLFYLRTVRNINRPFSGRYPYRILCLLSFCQLYTPFPQREKSQLQQHNYSRLLLFSQAVFTNYLLPSDHQLLLYPIRSLYNGHHDAECHVFCHKEGKKKRMPLRQVLLFLHQLFGQILYIPLIVFDFLFQPADTFCPPSAAKAGQRQDPHAWRDNTDFDGEEAWRGGGEN